MNLEYMLIMAKINKIVAGMPSLTEVSFPLLKF